MMTPNHQLDLRARHSNFQTFLDINETESQTLRDRFNSHLDLAYGDAPLQSMDIFPSKVPHSPIVVFIHGGYWRALDKRSYSFVAKPNVHNDITTCVINYRLIPTVSMEGLLNDVIASLHWIRKNASNYNGDAHKLTICGHSAGGHLALMSYLLNVNLRPHIRAICSLSGIFDLRPIKDSYLNEVLQFTAQDVERYSAINKDLSIIDCPVLLSVGADETQYFIEESENLYKANQQNTQIKYYKYPELNHYQIVHKLAQYDNPLVNFILEHSGKDKATN